MNAITVRNGKALAMLEAEDGRIREIGERVEIGGFGGGYWFVVTDGERQIAEEYAAEAREILAM